jgi:hypothetical protein
MTKNHSIIISFFIDFKAKMETFDSILPLWVFVAPIGLPQRRRGQ